MFECLYNYERNCNVMMSNDGKEVAYIFDVDLASYVETKEFADNFIRYKEYVAKEIEKLEKGYGAIPVDLDEEECEDECEEVDFDNDDDEDDEYDE